MSTTTFLAIIILTGFGLLMLYLLIGGGYELLSAENAFERHDSLSDQEGSESLYDCKFDPDDCDCDLDTGEHGSSGSGRTDVQSAKKHPRVPRRAWRKGQDD